MVLILSCRCGQEACSAARRRTNSARTPGGVSCPMLGAEALEAITRRAGLLALGSSRPLNRLPGSPFRGYSQWLNGPDLADHSGGPAQDSHLFPYCPLSPVAKEEPVEVDETIS